MITNGRATPITKRALERLQRSTKAALRSAFGSASPAGTLPARREIVEQMLSRRDADVRGDERGLELFQRLGIELAPREHAAERARQLFARNGRARRRAARSMGRASSGSDFRLKMSNIVGLGRMVFRRCGGSTTATRRVNP
jgi:hypothetical protein